MLFRELETGKKNDIMFSEGPDFHCIVSDSIFWANDNMRELIKAFLIGAMDQLKLQSAPNSDTSDPASQGTPSKGTSSQGVASQGAASEGAASQAAASQNGPLWRDIPCVQMDTLPDFQKMVLMLPPQEWAQEGLPSWMYPSCLKHGFVCNNHKVANKYIHFQLTGPDEVKMLQGTIQLRDGPGPRVEFPLL
ncbi:Oidioi.mRNA.OKI2018_I69.XSR.g16508.t1.cds [Oikopleura dioica]|uniref:Oidioi.mRNA.OKI2018_I69.XSR.g16508.t1.cds n=1 Tax=Oikopleura dioica TaxID=34765 RepID=A0ABN7SMP4_OIKDI|nr:Oidioi.mRNA.OKI2018_I69.XSR.g16508.t1.cds [Oikopleura dioica]